MMERTSNPLIHRLQQALETNAAREDIAEALAAAQTLGDQLPLLLAFRAQERIDADRFLRRRRIAFGIACSLFIFVCVISSVGLTTLMQMRANNNDEAIFQHLVDDGRWSEAQEFLDALDDSTRSRRVFVQGQQLVQQEAEREQQRKTEFEQILSQLRATDTVDADAASRLGELARSAEEQAIASELQAKVDEQDLLKKAQRVQDQTLDFQSLQAEVGRFLESETQTLSSDARAERVHELRGKLQQFVAKNNLSNPELSEAAKQTAELLVREDQRASVRSERHQFIAAITDACGDPHAIVRELAAFTQSFPNDPMTKSLSERVVNRKPFDALSAWMQVLSHAAFQHPQTVDGKQSQQWLEKLNEAISLDAQHPLAATAVKWRPHYQTIAKQTEAIGQLHELLQSDKLARMYVYPDNGIRYYSDLEPNRETRTPHVIEYFADLSLSRQTKNFGGRYQQQIQPQVAIAGHAAYAAKATKALVALKEPDFTPTVYRLINELRALNTDTEIDPILKLDLLRRLLQIGNTGSTPLKVAFGDWLQSLDASEFPWEANWLAPGDSDPNVVAARNRAIELLNSFGNWDERVKQMGESFRVFREPRDSPVQWEGWVVKEAEQFSIAIKTTATKGQLAVLITNNEGSSTFVPLDVSVEESPLSIKNESAQQIGAPVCVFPTPKNEPSK
jgi:hypothetical protein